MPEFRIEGGNSSSGEVGFVSYIEADDAEEALAIFRDAVRKDANELRAFAPEHDRDIKVLVYFNPGSLKVTEHVEECESDDDEDEDGEEPGITDEERSNGPRR